MQPGASLTRDRAVQLLDGFAFWGLAALVVWAPLPLGSNRAWAWFLLATSVGGLLLCWGAATALAPRASLLAPSRLRIPLLLFAGVCLWAGIQWLPGTPTSWHHPLWTDASRVLDQDLTGRISVSPERTLTALVRLLTYGGVFWLALQLCRSSERARRALYLMVATGTVYALYGLGVQFSGSEKILWLEKWAYRGVVTSTFVNRNSYATYAGLTLVCACALLLKNVGVVLRASAPARVKQQLLLRHLLGPGAPLCVAILVIATALLLTESRAGVLSTLVGLLALLVASFAAGTVPLRRAGVLSLAILGIATAVFWLSGENLARRLARTESEELSSRARGAVYVLVTRAIGDAPLLGTGYGSFREVFPLYRDATVEAGGVWEQAHSTYLENALELGVPAAAALCGAVLGCATCCWAGLRRRRRDRTYAAVGVAATALVAAHSAVDFSLQIPAVAVTFAFILGTACAQSFPSEDP